MSDKKFCPRDYRTQGQIGKSILLDVIRRFERGELTDKEAIDELNERLSPAPIHDDCLW